MARRAAVGPVRMDPALHELVDRAAGRPIAAIARLEPGADPPPGVRIVSRFGEVATCRIQADDVVAVRADDTVASLKAPRLVAPERGVEEVDLGDPDGADVGPGPAVRPTDRRRPAGLDATGRGVVLAVLDWGCDVGHRSFRHADGRTRLLALWDQRGGACDQAPAPFGYGRLFTRDQIDAALADDEPYAALGYHPGELAASGTHGTHVLSIAAGSDPGPDAVDGVAGMAPEADLVFVHLSTHQDRGLANLGDSVSILEALDFVDRVAGDRSCVVSVSVGRHGGPHDGSTLVEQGFDHFVTSRPGRCIVQSCGNYFARDAHTQGQLVPGSRESVWWSVDPADVTPNELEVWYSGRDAFRVEVHGPGGELLRLRIGEHAPLLSAGREVGHAYHRANDPNNGKHQVDVFLHVGAPPGLWRVDLLGDDVVDGGFHAWVERDAACRGCQSVISSGARTDCTTGTICNGLRTIAVGAYDAHAVGLPMARFSSAGPTVDGRRKPEVVAPGVAVLAARSVRPGATRPEHLLVRKSGTSMAAPYVAGVVACMFEVGRPDLDVRDVRAALAATARAPAPGTPPQRAGAGLVDPVAAVQRVRHLRTVSAGTGAPVDTMQIDPTATAFTRPGALFDALTLGAPDEESVADGFEVVVAPGERVPEVLREGDIVIWRALDEGELAGALVVGDAALIDAEVGGAALPGRYAHLVSPDADRAVVRRLTGPDGVLPADRVVVRRVHGASADGSAGAAEATTCAPAPERGSGGAARPLVQRGSRRPAVGYAQRCLNGWMAAFRAGEACATDAASRQYVESSLATLLGNGQLPLTVDCVFGPNTERAVKAFQRCRQIGVDGKIGPVTWPLLERYAAPTPTPTPVRPTGVRERQDAWALSRTDTWHPTLLWYARAVAALQARDGSTFADPMSWRHLAEIHGASVDRSRWPAGARWDECEHGSWFFLPWHRIYLHHFEKVVRAAVTSLGGPADWALPYWNYSDRRPDVRSLPPAFRQATTPDGVANPLFVAQRDAAVNAGDPIDAGDAATAAALAPVSFTSSSVPGFGGGRTTRRQHSGTARGPLERLPHGSVHVAVGGEFGWMSRFETAGRDPVFWLHHANVDRLWEEWLRRPGRSNPTEAAWLDQRFDFGSGPVTTSLTVREVVDPTASPLLYRYSDMPVTSAREAFEVLPVDDDGEAGAPVGPPELVGATSAPTPLGPVTTVATVALSAPQGPRRAAPGEADPSPGAGRVFLKLESIRGTRRGPGTFDVFVNVPRGADASGFPDRRVGRISTFGVPEASQPGSAHSGSGLDDTFEITDLVRTLQAAGDWDPAQVRISFRPVPTVSGTLPEGDVSVGRVSVFVA